MPQDLQAKLPFDQTEGSSTQCSNRADEEISGDDLPLSIVNALKSNELDPVHLGEEKKNIYETNNYYFYGDSSQITLAKSISDSDIQNGTPDRSRHVGERKETKKLPDSLEAMDRFLRELYPNDSFFAFLTLIFLKTVRDISLYGLSEQLRAVWRQFSSEGSQEDAPQTKLQSQMALLKEIFASIDTYEMNTAAGKVQVQCVHLQEEARAEQRMRWFWDLFPNYRKAIVDWLFQLARGKDRFAARFAREAVGHCSAFSFSDFQELILPQLKNTSDASAVVWLADILQKVGENPALSANVTVLTQHLTSSNSRLSTIGFYMLEYLDDPVLEKTVANLLEKILLGRIREGRLKTTILIAAVTQARRGEKMYRLLMESLRRVSSIASPAEVPKLQDAYLHLSMVDYLTSDRNHPELLLLDLRDKIARESSLPIFLQCWKSKENARFLTTLWDAYFIEAAQNKYSLEYTRVFWRRMAFQNSPVAFNQTQALLREAEWRHPKLSAFFRSMQDQIAKTIEKRSRERSHAYERNTLLEQ